MGIFISSEYNLKNFIIIDVSPVLLNNCFISIVTHFNFTTPVQVVILQLESGQLEID